jgi:hypothetical protein
MVEKAEDTEPEEAGEGEAGVIRRQPDKRAV